MGNITYSSTKKGHPPQLKKLFFFTLISSLYWITFCTKILGTEYFIIPEKSKIQFETKHLMFLKAKGSFKEFSGNIYWDESNLKKSFIRGKVYVKSISTHKKRYYKVLQKPFCFDSENYPYITFQTTKITKKENQVYKIEGVLSAKGTTLPLTSELQVSPSSKSNTNELIFFSKLSINRIPYGIASELRWPILDKWIELELTIATEKTHLIPSG